MYFIYIPLYRLYPVTLIDQCVKTFLNKIFVPKGTLIIVSKKDLLIILPF